VGGTSPKRVHLSPSQAAPLRASEVFVSGELDFTGAKVQGDRYKSAILNNGGTVLEDHVLDAGMANLDYLTHEIQNTDSGALKIEQNLTTSTRCTYSPVL
jgi:hypothetical protein